MTNTELDAIRNDRPVDLTPTTVGSFLNSMKGELARALPKGMDADRMARVTLTAVRKAPKLALCSAQSFSAALLTATALGLEPGVNDEAYLIPYGRECTLVIGYQGFVKLFWQHPLAQFLDAHVVYQGDLFDYGYGLNPYLDHKPATVPDLDDNGNRIPTHYYAVGGLSTGAKSFVVLTPADVKALRGGKVGPDKNFKGGDPMDWMGRKTALRQLFKMLPKSVTLGHALKVDEASGSELRKAHAVQVIADAEPDAPALTVGPVTDEGEPVDQATGEIKGDPWADPTLVKQPAK